MVVLFCLVATGAQSHAAEPAPHFDVQSYRVAGEPLPSTNALGAIFSKYIGTNVTRAGIGAAASQLQLEYFSQGLTNISVSVALDRIAKGVATLNAFRTPVPQILLSGIRYTNSVSEPLIAAQSLAADAGTNAPSATQTNTVPRFTVRAYEIRGDTLLSTNVLMSVLAKYTGTNVTLADILKAKSDLQMEYHDRGYPTVSVVIPPQHLTNGIVQILVFQGRLAEILVTDNRYFSSNNVMRSLPSLRTNTILSSPIFQAELDRANANQDRQVYPELEPGPVPNTTTLRLRVKDRLPLHAKVEFNNQSSPGTPELRVNTSAVYDNLWQLEHSLGVQYSFSPEKYKTGDQWSFYDLPLVANYSAFYRLPLGAPEPIADVIETQPGSFGFSEATRKFRLPPPSGRSELNLFGSQSTIDTGLETLQDQLIYNVPGVRQVSRRDVQQDVTINEDLGFRLSEPLPGGADFRSTLSGGLDYKTYSLTSNKTNNFSFTEITVNANGSLNPPIVSTVASPVPTTQLPLNYLPLSIRYDGSLRDKSGATFFGLGLTFNTWNSGSSSALHNVTGSTESSGNWVTLTPSLSRDVIVYPDWVLSLRADGQWASEPLISTERFGVGGVNSVRGYREGEVFGDTGWHISLEQKTPPHIIGFAYSKVPLTVRGAVYMDYARIYPLDPLGAPQHTSLWGTGFGTVFALGSHWEARFLFSVPLLSAGTTDAYQPRFNFALIGQF